MKIAISSSGDSLDSQIDPRFGRCAYFVIVNTDEMTFEAFVNKSAALSGGAGIQAAQFVTKKGAAVVITGNLGPNAMQALSASQVKIFAGQSGTIREAIERIKGGDIEPTNTPNVADRYGMGGGRGMGRGGGLGRGMGGSRWGTAGHPAPVAPSKVDELKNLKDQANELRKQIESIESNIASLEKQ